MTRLIEFARACMAWIKALLRSIEARVVAGWLRLKVVVAGYEARAVARLHAADLKDALKALHARVVDLEKRTFEDESAIARRARDLLAKL